MINTELFWVATPLLVLFTIAYLAVTMEDDDE
jgi:hypothetical protein